MRRQFPSTRRLLSAPNRLLLEAYEFFYQKLLDDPELSTSGQRLAYFLSNIAALKTLFIQVKVQDEVSAYTVFETLNARGTELSPTDLIKNYVFSMAPDQEGVIEHLEVRWQKIGSLVGLRLLPEFVRHYLTSPSDGQFLVDFSTWSVAANGPKKKLAKFILCELEGLASRTEARYDMARLTLEHILPISLAKDGLENRFGNYALLEKTLNREASSTPWPSRRAIYPRSQLSLTRTITAEKWDVEEIDKRQLELAELAVKRFRMSTDN